MNPEFLNNIFYISSGMLLLAFILTFIRLLKGPTTSDRVSAMDLIAIIVMGFIIIYALLIKNVLYLDIVIIISLVSFMGTVALSTYIKNKIK